MPWRDAWVALGLLRPLILLRIFWGGPPLKAANNFRGSGGLEFPGRELSWVWQGFEIYAHKPDASVLQDMSLQVAKIRDVGGGIKTSSGSI